MVPSLADFTWKETLFPADRALQPRPLLVGVWPARARDRGPALLQNDVCGATLPTFGRERSGPFPPPANEQGLKFA